MSRKKVVAHVRYDQNLFVLDSIKLGKAMAISRRRPRYIVSNNKQI